GVLGFQCGEERAAGLAFLQPYGGKLRQSEQELTSAFAEFSDLLAKLLGDLHDLLSNVSLARLAQFVFIIGLDEDRRENGDQHEDNQTTRQADMRNAPPRKPTIGSDGRLHRRACFMRRHQLYSNTGRRSDR